MPRSQISTSSPVTVAKARNGLGLLALRSFRRNQIIIKLVGRVVDAEILWTRGGRFADNCIRFGPETYLDPGDGPSRYLNHSCEPNAAIRKENNQLFLFATQTIKSGDEITFDYSTTLGDDDIWTMRCRCGRTSCRGTIKRFGSLPAALRQHYIERGLVPTYIVKTLGWRA